ncbi:unnamed protein product [Macrosiphum euphorbiae]|uniref:Uncharacterized protein n=1 Tax=Macrosiphum euphorbiae TaxID=13131 RepID=A0AAV0WVT7_9HEMI|nr:unnamed protein product [Macrosiphum euphorbiae]
MTPYHYLANILDPKYKGQHLNEEEMDQGINYVLEYHPEIMCAIFKFKAQTTPLKDYLFSNNALNKAIV